MVALLAASGRPAIPAVPVDLALVLAVDCSRSVDDSEFRMQMDGIAAAMRQPTLAQAVENAAGGIAVTLIQWSGARTHVQAIPWVALRRARDVARLADRIAATGRVAVPGSTAIGDALAFALHLLETGPFRGRRRIIDLSGDGMSNQGEWPEFVRPKLLAAGVTVNALAILDQEPALDRYFEERIVGGPGAFVVRAAGFAAFTDAMTRKLAREIAGRSAAGDLASAAAPRAIRVGDR